MYQRLAPGVLRELEAKNPSNEKHQRPNKHHQWLTETIGHPALKEHVTGLLWMMRASDDWATFMARLDRAAPRYNDTLPLPLPEPEPRPKLLPPAP